MNTPPRQDIHAEVTNKLIAAIESNPGEPALPWRKSGNPLWLPVNALTGKRYNGVNIISLWVAADGAGYTAPLWATYRQWHQRDAQVRKGEKASLVVFYKLCGRPQLIVCGATKYVAPRRSEIAVVHDRRFYATYRKSYDLSETMLRGQARWHGLRCQRPEWARGSHGK